MKPIRYLAAFSGLAFFFASGKSVLMGKSREELSVGLSDA